MSSTRNTFDKALSELQQAILRMGSLIEQAIYNAVQSLANHDTTLADEVINNDSIIDQMEMDIENMCLKLIATQQPIATDLRKISTGFKIITDLERMADHAVGIARVTKRLEGQALIKPLVDIPKMAALTQQMVKDVLDSYVNEDVILAGTLNDKDDEVDLLYAQVFRDLLVFMIEDQKTISQSTHLLFVARFLERIADHATNIGERVIYMVTGEHPNQI